MDKSFIEMKITGNSLAVCQSLISEYLELGFSTSGTIEDNNGLYWTVMIKNNGLLQETKAQDVPIITI